MRTAITILVLCTALLLGLGLLMLFSAGMVKVGAAYMIKQSMWAVFGVLLAVIIYFLGIDFFRKPLVVWGIWLVAIVLLGLVLVPGIGHAANGARRWLVLGPVMFQPSELAKIAIILLIASYASYNQRRLQTFIGGIVLPFILAGVTVALIYPEPDRGCTILCLAITLSLLFLAGIKLWQIALTVFPLSAVFLYIILKDSVRLARILSWLDVEGTKGGAGWQVWGSLLAFGSGGLFGRGLGSSRQKLEYIPFHYTDFILPVIGEELGFICVCFVILAFLFLVLSGLYIASKANNMFSFLVAAGCSLAIGLQAIINIGVVSGILPNKGLPLPFISYGGSNLLFVFACLGLILAVASENMLAELETPEPARCDTVVEINSIRKGN